MNTILI